MQTTAVRSTMAMTITESVSKPVLLATLPACQLDYGEDEEGVLKEIANLFFRMKGLGCQAIVLDCRKVEFIGSYGLGALIKLQRGLKEENGNCRDQLCVVANADSMLKNLVGICFMGLIPVESSVEEALNRL